MVTAPSPPGAFGEALSIVIPTWNGLDLLRRFLPSVTAEAERWRSDPAPNPRRCEVVISDDGSTDGTAAWLREHQPGVRVVCSPVNRGFSPAANAGVAAAREALVLLLNNDLELAPGSLDFLAPWFADPALFGVTLRGFDLPGRAFATGGKLGRFRRGFWETWRNYEKAPAGTPAPTFMLVGGFCVFRRTVFLELGGFDPIFAPYYSEDLDLSYRARKRGWRLGYEPRAVAYHARSSSVERHRTPFRRALVIERNRLLFHWRNLDAPRLRRNLLWSLLRLPSLLLRGEGAALAGWVAAVRLAPRVRAFRRIERPHWRFSDPDLALDAPALPVRETPPAPAASL